MRAGCCRLGGGCWRRHRYRHRHAPTRTLPLLPAVLESPTVGDAAVHDAVRSYLALLHGLVTAGSSSSTTNGATNGAGSEHGQDATLDDALAAAEEAAAPAGGPSRLRHALAWEWGEAALAAAPGSPPRTARSTDAAFEQASVLVAAALRLAHAAAAACADSPSGVPTPATTRAYRLLREAAGMLDAAGRLAPALPGGLSADLDAQVGVCLCSRFALVQAAGAGCELGAMQSSICKGECLSLSFTG